MIVLYKCDPEKHKECKRSICYMRKPKMKNPCRNTKHSEYAVLNEKGQPIVSYVRLDDKPDMSDGGGD